jgi:hypothetical protein
MSLPQFCKCGRTLAAVCGKCYDSRKIAFNDMIGLVKLKMSRAAAIWTD